MDIFEKSFQLEEEIAKPKHERQIQNALPETRLIPTDLPTE